MKEREHVNWPQSSARRRPYRLVRGSFTAAGLEELSFEDFVDPEDPGEPAVRRFRVLYRFTA